MESYELSTYLSTCTNKDIKDKVISEFGTDKIANCNKCSRNNRSYRDNLLYMPCYMTKECNIRAFIKLQEILNCANIDKGASDKISRAITRAHMLGMELEFKAPWVILKSDITKSCSVINLDSMTFDTRKYTYIGLGKSIMLGETTNGEVVIRRSDSLDNMVGDLPNISICKERAKTLYKGIHVPMGKMQDIYKNVAVCTATDNSGTEYILFVHSSGKRIMTIYTDYAFVSEKANGYYIELQSSKQVIKLDKDFNIERKPQGLPVISI